MKIDIGIVPYNKTSKQNEFVGWHLKLDNKYYKLPFNKSKIWGYFNIYSEGLDSILIYTRPPMFDEGKNYIVIRTNLGKVLVKKEVLVNNKFEGINEDNTDIEDIKFNYKIYPYAVTQGEPRTNESIKDDNYAYLNKLNEVIYVDAKDIQTREISVKVGKYTYAVELLSKILPYKLLPKKSTYYLYVSFDKPIGDLQSWKGGTYSISIRCPKDLILTKHAIVELIKGRLDSKRY